MNYNIDIIAPKIIAGAMCVVLIMIGMVSILLTFAVHEIGVDETASNEFKSLVVILIAVIFGIMGYLVTIIIRDFVKATPVNRRSNRS